MSTNFDSNLNPKPNPNLSPKLLKVDITQIYLLKLPICQFTLMMLAIQANKTLAKIKTLPKKFVW